MQVWLPSRLLSCPMMPYCGRVRRTRYSYPWLRFSMVGFELMTTINVESDKLHEREPSASVISIGLLITNNHWLDHVRFSLEWVFCSANLTDEFLGWGRPSFVFWRCLKSEPSFQSSLFCLHCPQSRKSKLRAVMLDQEHPRSNVICGCLNRCSEFEWVDYMILPTRGSNGRPRYWLCLERWYVRWFRVITLETRRE